MASVVKPADTDRVLHWIQKLLALSTSPNEHEAASAAAKAQALLFRYSLRIEDIDLNADGPGNGNPVREQVFGEVDDAAAHWQLRLASAVARTSMCVPLSQRFSRRNADGTKRSCERFVFVGRPIDIDLAKITLDFLTETLLKLATAYVEETGETVSSRRSRYESDDDHDRRCERTFRAVHKAYLDGAAASIAIRLTNLFEARRVVGEKSIALAVRRETEIEEYLAGRHHKEILSRPIGRETQKPYSGSEPAAASAYEIGFDDAMSITMALPLDKLGPG